MNDGRGDAAMLADQIQASRKDPLHEPREVLLALALADTPQFCTRCWKRAGLHCLCCDRAFCGQPCLPDISHAVVVRDYLRPLTG